MNRVDEIKRELARLEDQLRELQQELAWIQTSCVHRYREHNMIKICVNCQKVESLYY